MRLKAIDTLHVSSVKADNILPGEEFEVSDDIGRQLIERGMASKAAASAEPVKAPEPPKAEAKAEAKADSAPLNKMDAPPKNKAVKPPKRKGK